jgi:hypothetical protein
MRAPKKFGARFFLAPAVSSGRRRDTGKNQEIRKSGKETEGEKTSEPHPRI